VSTEGGMVNPEGTKIDVQAKSQSLFEVYFVFVEDAEQLKEVMR
jgi:hypothetical protein